MDEVTSSFDEFVLLDGSVPDLAATLTTQAEQDAEDTNLSFLRREPVGGSQDIWDSLSEDLGTTDPPSEDSVFASERRQAAAEAPSSTRRYADALRSASAEVGSSTGRRHHQSNEYRAWAPENARAQELRQQEQRLQHRRMEEIAAQQLRAQQEAIVQQQRIQELRAQQLRLQQIHAPQTRSFAQEATRQQAALEEQEQGLGGDRHDLQERMRNRLRREQHDARLAEMAARGVTSRQVRADESSTAPEAALDRVSPAAEASLRTTAAMQAMRRNSQMEQYTQNYLQRYILERENRGTESEDARESSAPMDYQTYQDMRTRELRRQQAQPSELLSEQHRDLERLVEDRWRNRTSISEFASSESRRRRHWHVSTSRPSADTRSVEGAIKYLGRLRSCESEIEGQETAAEFGFERAESGCPGFLTSVRNIPPPPLSSWLQMGCTLFGSQSAITPPSNTSASLVHSSQGNSLPNAPRSRIRHPALGTTTARTTSPIRQPHNPIPLHVNAAGDNSRSTPSTSRMSSKDENWPVKVILQNVDLLDMSLCGTMEAFNVPDKTSPTRESSISTYLDGEIIDFNHHTLETKNFRADSRIDTTYWLRLPPFREMKNEEEVIRCLTNEQWVREELMCKWILMRWKGMSSCSS